MHSVLKSILRLGGDKVKIDVINKKGPPTDEQLTGREQRVLSVLRDIL